MTSTRDECPATTRPEIVLGHRIDPNPDTVTDVPLRLPANEHYHTLFCGDTGFGKSVAAQRLVVESTRAWGLRTVVLDFGRHGWRRLANVPDLEGRVTVRQLEANGAWPLRWNPLQLGRRIDPEGQCRMFADIFCAIVGLDDVAAEELHNVLHACYRAAGVLVHDPATRADSQWATVGTVAEALGLDATARLTALEPADCQRVAVRRSQGIGFADLLAALRKAEPREYSRRDQRRRQQLERHLSVLSHAPHGSPYAPGSDVRDICELVPRPGGVTILEAGLPMDPTAGAFLLGWAGWQIHQDAHQDAVAQSLGGSGFKSADLQFVFEDAERIVHRVVSEGLILNNPFEVMWRDSRKYGICLHAVTQSPALLPAGVRDACVNTFCFQLKDRGNQEAIDSHLGLDVHRFRRGPAAKLPPLASLPVAGSLFGTRVPRFDTLDPERPFDEQMRAPVYVRPLIVDVPEPTDDELAKRQSRGDFE